MHPHQGMCLLAVVGVHDCLLEAERSERSAGRGGGAAAPREQPEWHEAAAGLHATGRAAPRHTAPHLTAVLPTGYIARLYIWRHAHHYPRTP